MRGIFHCPERPQETKRTDLRTGLGRWDSEVGALPAGAEAVGAGAGARRLPTEHQDVWSNVGPRKPRSPCAGGHPCTPPHPTPSLGGVGCDEY